MHDHTCQHHMGQQRISIVPACAKSIPYMSLLDNHSTCFIRGHGETMAAVHQTNDKDPPTLTLYNMETCSSNTTIVRLEAELSNLHSIYTSYQLLIQAATQLLQKETYILHLMEFQFPVSI